MLAAKTYIYPDGTKATRKPMDGEVFTLWDNSTQKPKSTWQWDDMFQQWFNVSSGTPSQFSTQTFVVPQDLGSVPVKIDISNIKVPECECGAKHTGAPQNHLRFCPLFTP